MEGSIRATIRKRRALAGRTGADAEGCADSAGGLGFAALVAGGPACACWRPRQRDRRGRSEGADAGQAAGSRTGRRGDRGAQPALARRRRPLLLAANAERLPELLPILRLCDGLILLDDAPAPVGAAVELAKARLCALPTALVERMRREEPRRRLLATLGPRELAVLRRLAAGAGNREIAASLGLPEATVKAILRRLTLRLGFDNRTQAAVFAARHL